MTIVLYAYVICITELDVLRTSFSVGHILFWYSKGRKRIVQGRNERIFLLGKPVILVRFKSMSTSRIAVIMNDKSHSPRI